MKTPSRAPKWTAGEFKDRFLDRHLGMRHGTVRFVVQQRGARMQS